MQPPPYPGAQQQQPQFQPQPQVLGGFQQQPPPPFGAAGGNQQPNTVAQPGVFAPPVPPQAPAGTVLGATTGGQQQRYPTSQVVPAQQQQQQPFFIQQAPTPAIANQQGTSATGATAAAPATLATQHQQVLPAGFQVVPQQQQHTPTTTTQQQPAMVMQGIGQAGQQQQQQQQFYLVQQQPGSSLSSTQSPQAASPNQSLTGPPPPTHHHQIVQTQNGQVVILASAGSTPQQQQHQYGATSPSGSLTSHPGMRQPVLVAAPGAQYAAFASPLGGNSPGGILHPGASAAGRSPGPSNSNSRNASSTTVTRAPVDPKVWGYAIVDPLHPSLQRIPVPPNAALPTQGIHNYNNDVAASSIKPCSSAVCMKYANNGTCPLGEQCGNFHVDKNYLEKCRQLVGPICCLNHNDCFGQAITEAGTMPAISKGRFILVLDDKSEIDLTPGQLAFTVGLEQLYVRANDVKVINLKKQVCRMHLEGKCKWTKDCGHVHICRELVKFLGLFHYPSLHFLLMTDNEAQIQERLQNGGDLLKFLTSHSSKPLLEQIVKAGKTNTLRALAAAGVAIPPAPPEPEDASDAVETPSTQVIATTASAAPGGDSSVEGVNPTVLEPVTMFAVSSSDAPLISTPGGGHSTPGAGNSTTDRAIQRPGGRGVMGASFNSSGHIHPAGSIGGERGGLAAGGGGGAFGSQQDMADSSAAADTSFNAFNTGLTPMLPLAGGGDTSPQQ